MALQGNLHDFSVNEILQLLGSQRKTGCLMLEWSTERAQIYVQDGRIVSTRMPGMKSDDALLGFLLKVHRLSDEQRRGILSIHRESGRDLEDLLVTGRYLDTTELKLFLERQILNDLMRVVRWENGNYRFEPKTVWPTPLVRLSMEGSLIEAARRGDEQKRYVQCFKNPYDLLGVCDLPDPDEPLSEEEKELFGIIDGHHTVEEVVEAAPLSDYEAYEALFRMLEARWIEVVGHRDPGDAPSPPRHAASASAARVGAMSSRELLVAVVVLVVGVGLHFGAVALRATRPDLARSSDVFAAAQMGEIRTAIELYRREHGAYPADLRALTDDAWLDSGQTRVPGYRLHYHAERGGENYRLDLDPER